MAYLHYAPITIDHTKCGATDSTNFPLLVSGTYTPLKTVANGGEVISSSGYDIQFFSDSGLTTALKFERVIWVASSGLVEFWVKIPTLSHTTDTVIYMAWGNAAIITDQQDSANTWDSNFKGVWHLGDGATLNLNDSTSNGNTLTNVGSAAATTGKISGGVQINAGGSGQALHPSNIASMGDFTISLWSYSTVNGNNAGLFWTDDYPASPRSGVGVKTYRAASSAGMIEGYDGAGGGTSATFTPASLNAWHKFTLRRSGSTLTLYIDGVSKASVTMGSGTITFANIYFGVHYYSGAIQEKDYEGKIDNVFISSAYRSDDWDTAEYNNQNSPSTFYTVGSEQSTDTFIASVKFVRQAVNRASTY